MNFNLRKRLAKDIKNLDYDLNTIIHLLFKDFLNYIQCRIWL